ncbi:von Willebrand factor type A [Ferrimonas balearica DSM 9799]|uniref:von Willebrand factor type A n=1 Tax=Ferrimonas balearica (strain DSM 9799 / CCM 4581 / KCTC 23876 / PAT) TaxID=550540 RepID=E1SP24_FERBD|nr:VWA domain-containing protein [Ferrimonas balearica]ADN74673.1 von Willebrand factor type A [Ferrimonas balearica DSM 9799]
MLDLTPQLQGLDSLLAQSPALQARLTDTLAQLDREARATLANECPYQPELSQCLSREQQLAEQGVTPARLATWLEEHDALMARCGVPANRPFWQQQRSQLKQQPERLLPLARLLLQQQRRALEQAQAQWQLNRLSVLRRDYLARLQAWLDTLLALQQRFRGLGLDPGVLVDLADSDALQQTAAELNRWADYLRGNPGILDLCERIGRHRQPQSQTEWHPITRRVAHWPLQANAPAPESLFGLLPGRDLPQLLPSEWAQLGDPELASLFELKYLEARLLAYQRRGWQRELQWRQETRLEPSETERARGPLVIAVDTSLSMQGTPESAAKAIALCLSATARSHHRPVHLINFATELAERDLTQHSEGLLGFLQLSFHGGTDVALALEAALNTLSRPDYELADVVLLSDMVLLDLPQPLLQRIDEARRQGHQIHAVAIGEIVRTTNLNSRLDCQWQFCPLQGDIEQSEGEAPAAAVQHGHWQGLAGSA